MSLNGIQALSLEQVSEIDDIVTAFENAIAAGDEASIDDALKQTSELLQPILLLELIGVEMEVRSLSPRECLRDYVSQFSQYEELIRSEFGRMDSLDENALEPGTLINLTPDRLRESGEVQFGRYRVIRHVGRGGMADVFFASDNLLNREIAIKVPLPGVQKRAGYARFLQEARTMAQAQHANVCPVLDVGIHGEQPYISMSFIHGTPLNEYLRLNPNLPTSRVVEIFSQIADGVQAAHDAGVLHRDLKPTNVIVDASGVPIVTDFGFSEADRDDPDACLVGSPAYMSPEQAGGEADEITVSSDVYSLGALLVEMLSGRRLFSGSVNEVLEKVKAGDIPAITNVPPEFASLCEKALSFNPAERHSSAQAFAQDVQAAQRPQHRSQTSLLGLVLASVLVLVSLPFAFEWYADSTGDNAASSDLWTEIPLSLEETVQDGFDHDESHVVAGDLDGDGDIDLVVTSQGRAESGLRKNDGTGQFGPYDQVMAPAMISTAEIADFDGDNDLDVVLAGDGVPCRLCLNDGQGEFTVTKLDMPIGSFHHVAIGDTNNDGLLDLFFANATGPNALLLNEGQTVFRDSGQQFGSLRDRGATFIDIDQDNDLDIVTASLTEGVLLWTNDGTGAFATTAHVLSADKTLEVTAADIDQDGVTDIIASKARFPSQIYFGNGTLDMVPGPVIGKRNSTGSAVLDLNNDGQLDLVVAVFGQPNLVAFNNGQREFSESVYEFGAAFTEFIAAGDFDGDGNVDFYAANAGNQPDRIWWNRSPQIGN